MSSEHSPGNTDSSPSCWVYANTADQTYRDSIHFPTTLRWLSSSFTGRWIWTEKPQNYYISYNICGITSRQSGQSKFIIVHIFNQI